MRPFSRRFDRRPPDSVAVRFPTSDRRSSGTPGLPYLSPASNGHAGSGRAASWHMSAAASGVCMQRAQASARFETCARQRGGAEPLRATRYAGIDLGTSNSAVAVVDLRDGGARPRIGERGPEHADACADGEWMTGIRRLASKFLTTDADDRSGDAGWGHHAVRRHFPPGWKRCGRPVRRTSVLSHKHGVRARCDAGIAALSTGQPCRPRRRVAGLLSGISSA